MVFEAVVVDVLNRFLGDYVENLDRSQLKIGIWGGDVVLENLILKQNALEELNIPVQTVYGHLGKLVLKIPWKNLYGESVEASVEKLFLIVNPTVEVKYDKEKEEKMALASKQAELARVEEAKKKEAQKDQDKVADSFAEKLVAQIIKNVQIKIKSIHIRYEDTITNPGAPFSCGLTLHNLSVHTTDETWKKTVIQRAVTKIYKILSLEGLAIYWNPSTKMYSKLGKKEIVSVMQKEIATKSTQPNHYLYMVGPINATAKLKLNPKPEADEPRFTIPKVILSLHMEQLMVSVTKSQYQDLMKLADSMERMSKGAPYRKYRPFLKSYRGHYKEWWIFAYQCILEEEVRRKKRNWDWNHISKHRHLCKQYAHAYQIKLTSSGKVGAALQSMLDKGEKELDLFNLVVIRHQIETEVARLGKIQAEANKNRGWFGGWFGGRSAKDGDISDNNAIMTQFRNAMTPDEKDKLFRAIDYQENSVPLHLPGEYVALDAQFRLDRLQVSVTEATKQVVCAMVDKVEVAFTQRPGADAIKVDVQMQKFSVLGVKQGGMVPNLVSSKDLNSGDNLLNISFETNPLSNDCDQRVQVSARPLQIVYDAQTVIDLVSVFKPPSESTALTQLQAVAGHTLLDLKEKSALGMQYAVNQHHFIDINVDVAASYLIVPQGGIYNWNEACLVVKLGAISVKSEPRSLQALDVHKMFKEGLADDEILKELIHHTYDKLVLYLTEMQIVIAGAREDWKSAITGTEATPLHLLLPTTLKIQIHKCLVTDDPRLPKVKVMGELQQIAVNASEDRLLTLLEVAVSIPLPQSDYPTPALKQSDSKSSNLSLFHYLDPAEKKKRDIERTPGTEEHTVQLTNLEAFFIMKELTLNLRRKPVRGVASPDLLLRFSLENLELKATQKTFTLQATVKLGAVSLDHYRPGFDTINMIETPRPGYDDEAEIDEGLFTVTYTNVDKRSPDFRSHYGSVEQLICLQFTTLKLLLHLEGLKQLLVIANGYQQRILSIQGQKDRAATAGTPLETIMEEEDVNVGKSKVALAFKLSKRSKVESIQMKVQLKLGAVIIRLATDLRPLADACVNGLHVGLIMKQSYMQVDCALQEISIVDLNPDTIHTQILKVLGGDVINVRTVLYNLKQFPEVSNTDISIDAQINCLRIIFLNWFVTSILDFLNNFQEAQQAIIEASTVAADAARANVHNAYKNSTKVALKVHFSAPIIIAPENSKSSLAVVVDLGQMQLNNKFFDLEVENIKHHSVTVDELTLALENMKVSTVKLVGGDNDYENERIMLRPTSFNLLVKRSLSGWFEALPDLDISGRLKTIAIIVGHSDFQMIMRVLNQNLKEGQVIKEEPVKVQSVHKVLSSKVTSGVSVAKLPSKMDNEVSSKTLKAPRTTIKFAFTMDSLMIDLVNTPTGEGAGLMDNLNTWMAGSTKEDTGLARFCLALLSVKGRMLSDNSMHTSLLLVDCTLDDQRPARGDKITRYFERRSESPLRDNIIHASFSDGKEKIRSMIDVTYTMKNSDTFIDLRIFSFNLILAVDFLMKIAEFMTSGVAVDPLELEEDIPPAPIKSGALLKSQSVVAKKKTVQTPATTAKPSMMTVNIKVEQPDIILVESLADKECDALIMNTEVTFKLRITEERMVMDGAISGLQVFMRRYWVGGGGDVPPHFLLEPCSVSLAAARPPDSGMHVDIAVSNIKINVSPETIALLNRVLVTMTRNEDTQAENEGTKVYVYRDLWNVKPFKHNSYWFLNTEIAEDALTMEFEDEATVTVKPPSGEICMLSSPSIILSLEMSIGTETIPALVLQSSLSAQIKDWSTELSLESTCSLQVMYYSIARAVWEPLVEPVEILKDNQYKHVPWELKMEVLMRSDDPLSVVDMADEAALAQAIAQAPPKTSVAVSSTEPLEITITTTCMEVMSQLANSFSAAVAVAADTSAMDKSRASTEMSQIKYAGAPYVMHNCTGLTVQVLLHKNDDFTVYSRGDKMRSVQDYREVLLEAGASVPLQLKKAALNLLTLDGNLPQLKMHIKMLELDEEVTIAVERADKRYFPIGRRASVTVSRGSSLCRGSSLERPGSEAKGLISEVAMNDGAINIYLRSVVQVRNTLSVSVCVYYMTASGNEVRSLGNVLPGEVLRLPLQAAHTPTAEIFFSVDGFTVSVSPFVWRELQQEVNISRLLQCDSKDKSCAEKFYIRAVGSMEQVYLEDTNRHTLASTCYNIVLAPAVKLQNCLPVDVVVSQLGLKRMHLLKPGEMFHLSHLAPNRATVVVMLQSYMDKCWVCTENLPEPNMELSVWSFDSHDSPAVMTLDLGVHSFNQDETQMLSLYCPFWMLNKTGLTLAYRTSDDSSNVLHHPANNKEPVLFSFRAKNFFGKKKASIRVEFGEWSEKFSLDVAGSSGVVLCRNEGRLYQVAVSNQLTFNSLTKMVIFTPYFLIINEAPFTIECQEMHRSADKWLKVEGKSSTALWPATEREDKLLLVRVAGSDTHAHPFLYTEQHTTTLKLNNEYGGLHVETQLSEGGTYVTIRQYRDGLAPALIINYTPHTVTLYEKENVNVRKLETMHRMLYTWENPAGPRVLIFEAHKQNEIENELRQDGIGEFMINHDEMVFWVSFLDGLQRVLLFTDNELLAHGVHTAGELGQLDKELSLSVQGVGLSLVNDSEHKEILYISISNSGIVWEQCKIGARRYKKMEDTKALQFEEAYQRYQAECIVAKGQVPGRVQLDNKIEVDFYEMRQLRPSARLVRRTLEPGVWASCGVSAHLRRFHARLHRLQIDQQLPMPTFPVVLAPVPPPRSVAADGQAGIKPFVEVSVVERVMEHSKVRQYKYCKILVQEFHVKIDMGLVNALIHMFPQKTPTEQEALELFAADLRNAARALETVAAQEVASDQKHFYDMLHLSPLKVHVSFSLGGTTQLPTFIGTLLQGIGVTLTDMNDVIFKLAYYEKDYEFLSQRELVSQATSHYTGQALKQLYVLVLGLDVIGNPYGLVIGLKKGVEDLFYEPFQGAIQGPGEFAEGLFLGVRSLVGHTVGGAAGAVSRIAGAMGHGLAALSLDKDYQRRRRDNMNKTPANLQEGLARSGKGLVMGVVDGVTGVFTKPISGAREQGVEGFFKGLGKGAVGLVARPTAGVVDFASGSFGAVKRVAEMSEEVTRRRPSRYLPQDCGVRPYSRVQAEGYKLLFELEKGKFTSTDIYVTHVWVVPTKEVAVCTDKRLLFLEKNTVFGGWQTVWMYIWSEIPEAPTLVDKGVFVPVVKKKVLGMFSSSTSGKLIPLYDEQQKKYLHTQCDKLWRATR